MPKASGTSNTSPALRSLIIQKAEEGFSKTEIAKLVGVSRWTVSRVIKNYHNRGHHNDAPRSGRPAKTSERTVRHIKFMLNQTRRHSLAEITSSVNNALPETISTHTVRRVLHNSLGMTGCVAAKKPFLKPAHRTARQTWANEYRGWGDEDWKHIIWTDESSVEIGKHSRRVWVWRRPGERYDEQCIVPTFKSGRESLMVWACFSHGRLGPLVRIPKDKRTGADYVQNVLAGALWDFYSELYEEKGRVAIVEDGVPIHRSKLAKTFRAEHLIEVLPHPAQSPDLNPIEHIWTRLKTGINR
jgi:transposase